MNESPEADTALAAVTNVTLNTADNHIESLPEPALAAEKSRRRPKTKETIVKRKTAKITVKSVNL